MTQLESAARKALDHIVSLLDLFSDMETTNEVLKWFQGGGAQLLRLDRDALCDALAAPAAEVPALDPESLDVSTAHDLLHRIAYNDGEPATDRPWNLDTASRVKADDHRVLILGHPPLVDARMISEPNWRLAVRCVNLVARLGRGAAEAPGDRDLSSAATRVDDASDGIRQCELCAVEVAGDRIREIELVVRGPRGGARERYVHTVCRPCLNGSEIDLTVNGVPIGGGQTFAERKLMDEVFEYQHGAESDAGALDPYQVVEDSWSDVDSWLRDEIRIPEIAEKILYQDDFAAIYGALWLNRIGRGAIHALAKAAVAKSARRALDRRSEAAKVQKDASIANSGSQGPGRADHAPVVAVLRRILAGSDPRYLCSADMLSEKERAERGGAGWVRHKIHLELALIEGRLVTVGFPNAQPSFILPTGMKFEDVTARIAALNCNRKGETPTGWAIAKLDPAHPFYVPADEELGGPE